ncbi:hypothetical protein EAG_00012, partial [Camponotus floridanus]
FFTYLYRIGKVDSALCPFCEEKDDSPDHTLQRCVMWDDEREVLRSIVDQDL